MYAFFWVIPRRLEFICRRFGTLSVPKRREKTPDAGELPKRKPQHTEHGESLKLRILSSFLKNCIHNISHYLSLTCAIRFGCVSSKVYGLLCCLIFHARICCHSQHNEYFPSLLMRIEVSCVRKHYCKFLLSIIICNPACNTKGYFRVICIVGGSGLQPEQQPDQVDTFVEESVPRVTLGGKDGQSSHRYSTHH